MNKLIEEWKPITGYEGLYEISSFGRTRSLDRFVPNGDSNNFIIGKVLSNLKSSNGYLQVSLSREGIVKIYRIHRLVAEAFIPNPENKKTVNHKDEDKINNKVNNLEWFTMAEQNIYNGRSFRVGKTKSKAVVCLETNVVYYSAREASRKTGLRQLGISMCCSGNFKQTGGFHWKYEL